MVREVIEYLDVRPARRYIDATVGAGGHAEAILEAASPGGRLLGLDADPEAIAIASERLRRFGDGVRLVQANFRDVGEIAREQGFVPVQGVLFDLGVSSMQLAGGRGFSFQREDPLDMRMDPRQSLTAAEIINTYREDELAGIIWRFGEERRSRRIARAIGRARPVKTAAQLASVVEQAVGRGRDKIHPATRTFQALRIAVNQELDILEEALRAAHGLLDAGSRIVAISFHSLEDRVVKEYFRRESRDCLCEPGLPRCVCGHRRTLRIVTRKPVKPGVPEIATNPRSRSAKLRAAERLAEAV